jgi:hypothetical protein
MMTLFIITIIIVALIIIKNLVKSEPTEKSIDLTETLTTPSTDIHVEIAKMAKVINEQAATEPVAKKKAAPKKSAAPKTKATPKKGK